MTGAASSLLLLGAEAVLTAIDGSPRRIDMAACKTTVVVFASTVCPVAGDYYHRIAGLWSQFGRRPGVGFWVVYPNKTESLDDIRRHAAEMKFPFPVYRDDNNVLADVLAAQVTPTAVVRVARGNTLFRGPIDDAANPARVKPRYLHDAIRASLAGRKPKAGPPGQPYG